MCGPKFNPPPPPAAAPAPPLPGVTSVRKRRPRLVEGVQQAFSLRLPRNDPGSGLNYPDAGSDSQQ